MEDKIAAYKERQKDKRRTLKIMITFWVIYVAVSALISYYVRATYLIFFIIGYFGGPATLFVFLRMHPTEKYEIRISDDFSKALAFLKLSKNEKGRAATRHRKRATNYV